MKKILLIALVFLAAAASAQDLPYIDSLNYYFTGLVNDYRNAREVPCIWMDANLADFATNHVWYLIGHPDEGLVHSIHALAENDSSVFQKVVENLIGPGNIFVENVAKIKDDGNIRTIKQLAQSVFDLWASQANSSSSMLNDAVDFFYIAYGETDEAYYLTFIGVSEKQNKPENQN